MGGAFGVEFPWLNELLPPIPGDYDFTEATIDADTLDRQAANIAGMGKRERILIVNARGNLLTEVREAKGFAARGTPFCWPWSHTPAETVSETLVRLGSEADKVAFVVTVTPQATGATCVTIGHTRGKTTVAEVWRRLAAQEEARVREKLRSALSA